MHKKLIILVLFLVLILTSGFGCNTQDKEVKQALQPITIKYWRAWDESDAFSQIIESYNAIHPNINIEYRKLRYDEFEKELIEAFATDRGPDIFSIENTWVKKYKEKGLIAPMPAQIKMVYPVIEGAIKKETVWTMKTNKSITLKEINNNFVESVYKDVVYKVKDQKTQAVSEQVYGLPLFMDTLALYYNRDLFNNAGISNPPQYWNREFQQNVKKLTKQDNKGILVQSGVALGSGANIDRSYDILSVLMMQNGTEMMTDSGGITFAVIPEAMQNKTTAPGLDALRFYTDFANPAKEVYSWNKSLDNSLELFLQGKLAMMFGYSYMIPTIKARAPKLNFGIAPLPQIEGNPQSINMGNYWVEVVSKKSKYSNEAWDFVQFITKAEQARVYLEKTKRPSALRNLIPEQTDDQDIGVFAEQVLTAKTWYQGMDPVSAQAYIEEMIDNVAGGQYPLDQAIQLGASKVQQTIYNKSED